MSSIAQLASEYEAARQAVAESGNGAAMDLADAISGGVMGARRCRKRQLYKKMIELANRIAPNREATP